MKIVVEHVCFAGENTWTQTWTGDVTTPPEQGLDAWARDELACLDPRHYTHQDGFMVRVTECPDRPDLVGSEFSWWIR